MEKKQNVPALRFQGFSDEWERKVLSEICDIFDGTHQTPHYTSSGVPFLSVENIKTLKSSKYISWESFTRDFKVYPQINDLLMTRIGDIGTVNVVSSNEPKAYYVTLALLKSPKLNSFFLKEAIASTSVQADLWHRTLHTAFPKKINKNEIGKVVIKAPKRIEEQKAVGNLFKCIEKLIDSRSKKIQKLQQFRQAMLTKLFPREGAAEPELRFRGFSGKWEQRKLLENFQKIIDFRGRTPKKLGMDWSKEGYLALSALNVKDGYIDFKQECHYGSRELYDKWMTGNELHKGQVIFTTEAPMGNVAQIPDNKKYILSQRTIAFEVKPDLINEDFLAILLRTPQMFQKLSALSSGGTAKGISQRSMEAVDAFFPIDILEQKKIGDFFKDLDFIISLQQEKLERMQRLKAALLEKMFV